MAASLNKPLTIATRGSRLAIWQAEFVADLLEKQGVQTRQLVLKTTGDMVQDRFLHEIGGKGLFIKELEEALRDGRADMAVHSMKDMPALVADSFAIAAVLPRHRATDILILRPEVAEHLALPDESLSATEFKALGPLRIATGSLRRRSLLLMANPDCNVDGLRGNVDTRLRKLMEGGWDGILLAEASIERLGLRGLTYRRLNADWFVPSPAQGALAIETTAGSPVRPLLEILGCPATTQAVTIERKVLAGLGGDCTLPFACHVHRGTGGELEGQAMVLDGKGSAARACHTACADDSEAEKKFARDLLDKLLSDGAENILKTLGLKLPVT